MKRAKAEGEVPTLHFNLRNPRKVYGQTIIYAVIAYEGRATKTPVAKIHAFQFDRKHESVRISPDMSCDANREALKANTAMAEARALFLTLLAKGAFDLDMYRERIRMKSYVTGEEVNSLTDSRTATDILSECLNEEIAERNSKASTAEAYKLLLKDFLQYLTQKRGLKDTMRNVSQTHLNEYKEYLINKGFAPITINARVRLIARLTARAKTENPHMRIDALTAVGLKKRVKSEGKKTALTAEEQTLLENATFTKTNELLTRDISLLMLATGQRLSDTFKLIAGEYTTGQTNKGTKAILLKTKKRGKFATITITPRLTTLLDRIRGYGRRLSEKKIKNLLKVNLKSVAAKAGLHREITYIDTTTGKSVTKELCEIISSHYFRHTFATERIREGFTAEQVGAMIGDDARMIESVYLHRSKQDLLNRID